MCGFWVVGREMRAPGNDERLADTLESHPQKAQRESAIHSEKSVRFIHKRDTQTQAERESERERQLPSCRRHQQQQQDWGRVLQLEYARATLAVSLDDNVSGRFLGCLSVHFGFPYVQFLPAEQRNLSTKFKKPYTIYTISIAG